eukprot:363431-Chlamydomonas_euryale.AAC.5
MMRGAIDMSASEKAKGRAGRDLFPCNSIRLWFVVQRSVVCGLWFSGSRCPFVVCGLAVLIRSMAASLEHSMAASLENSMAASLEHSMAASLELA